MSFFGTSGATSFGRCCPSWCFCLDHWRRLSLSGVRSDTPPVVLLEVFGWRCDPVLQRRWAVFSEVILLNGRPRPWQDTAPMRVALRLWRRLLPLARSVLAELDWWTTDGDIILRRDALVNCEHSGTMSTPRWSCSSGWWMGTVATPWQGAGAWHTASIALMCSWLVIFRAHLMTRCALSVGMSNFLTGTIGSLGCTPKSKCPMAGTNTRNASGPVAFLQTHQRCSGHWMFCVA